MKILGLAFWGTSRTVSLETLPWFYIATSNVWEFYFLHSLTSTCFYSSFQWNHFSACDEVVALCVFIYLETIIIFLVCAPFVSLWKLSCIGGLLLQKSLGDIMESHFLYLLWLHCKVLTKYGKVKDRVPNGNVEAILCLLQPLAQPCWGCWHRVS